MRALVCSHLGIGGAARVGHGAAEALDRASQRVAGLDVGVLALDQPGAEGGEALAERPLGDPNLLLGDRGLLLQLLRERGCDQLIICGVYAHIGCLATATDGFMRGVQPFVVADATADFSEQDHVVALRQVARTCGVVTTTDELLAPLHESVARAAVAQLLESPADAIALEDDLGDHGLDSIRFMQLVERSQPVAVEAAPEDKPAKKAAKPKAETVSKEDKKAKAEAKKAREKAAKAAKAEKTAKAAAAKADKKKVAAPKKKKAAAKKKKSSK